MKSIKKKIIIFLIIGIMPLAVIGIIVGMVDPFFVYHPPLENGYYIVDNQLEQNPGMAKHFEYNSVMLGSSMTTNFDSALFDKKLGCNMIKLSYNAAYPHDIDKIMGIVTENKDVLTHAFLCIDIANYLYEPGTLSYTYPEHLYDNNVLNDLKYLLNKDVLLDYVLIPYKKESQLAINEIYWHWQHMTYGRAHVLSNYTMPQKEESMATQYSIDNLKKNLETYIVPYIQTTPDTKWHVFFPPYSMLYWNNSIVWEELDVKLKGMEYITEYLQQFDNVEIYYFQDCEDWIVDLDNYTDVTHYSKEISDLMTEQLCNGINKVTKENYQERLMDFQNFVKNFDYRKLINGGN